MKWKTNSIENFWKLGKQENDLRVKGDLKVVNAKRVYELREENKELLNFTYDSSAYKTRDIKTLLKDKKGICYDFVNYLYYKYNKRGKCYFMWFNNQQGSTHTIYITEDNYYVEATPEEKKPLDYIYVEKVVNVLELAKNMANQIATGYWKDSPKFRICEYVPKNVSQTIDQFIDERWIDGHFDN